MKDRAKVEDLLVASDLQVQSSETAWKHVRAEYVDIIDDILATLAPSGPYAYTVSPSVEEGKELPTQRIVTTFDEIAASYRGMHRYAAVVAIRPVAEINTSWYTFVSGRGRGRLKTTGEESERPVIVLFPTMGSEGITGELFWGRTQQDSMPGDPADGVLAGRYAVAGLHETLLDAYRKGDVDTIVEKAHPEIQGVCATTSPIPGPCPRCTPRTTCGPTSKPSTRRTPSARSRSSTGTSTTGSSSTSSGGRSRPTRA